MIQKHFYEAPEAELLKVNFERNFLESDIEPGNPNDPFGPTRHSMDYRD